MVLNNLLSTERGGLASSQGDYIPRQSQYVLTRAVIHRLQGQTVGCDSLRVQHKNIMTVNNHHQGSYLMGCIKRDYSHLISPKSRAAIQSLQLNWSFILIFHTFREQSDQITF